MEAVSDNLKPPEAHPQKPCDASCPKCGGSDVYRRYRRKGEEFSREPGEYDSHEDGAIAYDTYRAMATEECIQHRCRTCGFEWNTPPLTRKEPK